jgi:hypothetical protein
MARTFKLRGGAELPILNLPAADLWLLAPSLFAFTAASGLPGLGRFGPVLGVLAAALTLLASRWLLVLWRRAFPGQTIPQLLAWYAQADRYTVGRDPRTFRVGRRPA